MGVLPGDFAHSYQMNRFDCRYWGLIVCFDYPLHFPQVLDALMRALLRNRGLVWELVFRSVPYNNAC